MGPGQYALLYRLIETAKTNKLEPYVYLLYISEKLPVAVTLEDYSGALSAPVVVECA